MIARISSFSDKTKSQTSIGLFIVDCAFQTPILVDSRVLQGSANDTLLKIGAVPPNCRMDLPSYLSLIKTGMAFRDLQKILRPRRIGLTEHIQDPSLHDKYHVEASFS